MNKLTMSGSVGLAALVTAGLVAWQAPTAFSRSIDFAASGVVQRAGADDGPNHDAGDDHAGHHRHAGHHHAGHNGHAGDDVPNHDAGDDPRVRAAVSAVTVVSDDYGPNHDVGDDHGGDDHGGHGGGGDDD